MATHYCCCNENRRDAVRTTTGMDGKPLLNGIDYLEVVSQDEKKIAVYFIHNLPGEADGFPATPDLAARNFVIEGGVRIQGIRVAPPIIVEDNVATLQVSAAGDYSSYVLRLVAGEETTDPPQGFDPQLAAVTFSFKVECPNEFDCKPGKESPAEALPAPLIDYLAKDYGSFRRLMLDRLATIMPDWKERNPADMQVALVEAVAYLGDHLSYYQDSVATEEYLGTARQRISMRRHARLLDYYMHDGCNARAWVCFDVEAGSDADHSLVPAGTPLLTRGKTATSRVAPADYGQILEQESPTVFETLHELTLESAHNAISFYTWDDTGCCLPKGATCATLYNTSEMALGIGDVLLFEEVISPETGLAADADRTRRHAVRLTNVVMHDSQNNPLVDPLHGIPIAEIAWDAADALPFPLCISREIDTGTGPRLVPDLSLARGNVVLADHGRTLPPEEIGRIGNDAAGRLIQPTLELTPVTQQGHARDRFGELVRDKNNQQVPVGLHSPAATAFQWQMRDVLPAVILIEHDDVPRNWLPQHDLLASGRFDRHFTLEIDNNGRAHLRFGDGFHGAIPNPDSVFYAIYRVGNGGAGNVGAGAISRVVLPSAGVRSVRNPFPATGGTGPESLEQVRQYAPQAFRTQERAVTVEDYAAVTERHPEIQKAMATLRWTGSWHTIFITVDRAGGRPIDASFKAELRAFLERFRLAGEDVEIDGPHFIPLDIAFTVCVKPGYYCSQVKADLLKLFSSRELPDGGRGFFHPDNFTFGQPVYLSPIIALAMQVPGVKWVESDDTPPKPNRFRRWGEPAQGELDAGKITFGRLEIARLDNDPSVPENGKIDFIMEGGL
jgi:hypothetical protein